MNPAFWNPLGSDRTLGDRCIVSAGTEPHYYEGLHSTRLHCTRWAPEAWQLFYYGYPDGCPKQVERMYAFKIYALQRSIEAGFQHVLWLDSAFQPVGSMRELWREIEVESWYVQQQGNAVLGNWCSDAALDIFGIDRDQAMTIPLCYSGLVGLNMHTDIGNEIWQQWRILYASGSFEGAHTNVMNSPLVPHGHKTMGHCSSDSRCIGHRHDEAALSFILWKLGKKPRLMPFFKMDTPLGFIGHHVELVCR